MTLKQKFAQKMLDDKLDFLPLKESLELHDSGEVVETKFMWVSNVEEVPEHDELTTEEILSELEEVYGVLNDYYVTIGDEEKFDEFTLELCPAPTYIDLIK
jgi:hypothetical protein